MGIVVVHLAVLQSTMASSHPGRSSSQRESLGSLISNIPSHPGLTFCFIASCITRRFDFWARLPESILHYICIISINEVRDVIADFGETVSYSH